MKKQVVSSESDVVKFLNLEIFLIVFDTEFGHQISSRLQKFYQNGRQEFISW